MTRVVQRAIRIALLIVFAVAAAGTVASSRFALLAVSNRVHDLFGLSIAASALLLCLFVGAAIAQLPLFDTRSPYAADPRHFRRLADLLIAAASVGLSLLIIVGETPTSFVSWEQLRGSPLAWLQNGHFFGPSISMGRMLRTYWLVSFKPMALVADLSVILVAVSQVRRLTTR